MPLRRLATPALLSALALAAAAPAADWPQFRGPNCSGRADAMPLPAEIGPETTVVWKPAEYAAASAMALFELIQAAGLPEGVLNIVFADGPATFDGLEQSLEAGTLDKIGAYPDLHNIGNYKTASNQYTEKSYTAAHREMDQSLNRDLYEQLVDSRLVPKIASPPAGGVLKTVGRRCAPVDGGDLSSGGGERLDGACTDASCSAGDDDPAIGEEALRH